MNSVNIPLESKFLEIVNSEINMMNQKKLAQDKKMIQNKHKDIRRIIAY